MLKLTWKLHAPVKRARCVMLWWSVKAKVIALWNDAQSLGSNRRYRSWLKSTARQFKRRKISGELKVSILITVFNTDPILLLKAIRSAQQQSYDNIEICIADDCSTCNKTLGVIDSSRLDPRVKVTLRKRNGHISEATNTAFAMATGDWITILDHDDMLHPGAIEELVNTITKNPDALLVYSDEDKINQDDRPYSPFFKPDFSYELLRSQNYFNHLTAYRACLIRKVGGWRKGFEGSQDYDLNLRVVERVAAKDIIHIPKVLYHWRAVKGSTALRSGEKSYAQQASKKALEEHAARLRLRANVELVAGTQYYRMRHQLPSPPPPVTIVIKQEDDQSAFERWVERLIRNTSYRPLEIVVVGCDTEACDRRFMDQDGVRVRRLVGPVGANVALTWNTAVAQSTATCVCILGGEMVPSQANWLHDLVAMGMKEDVGCVGPKISYPGNTVHSAGIALGPSDTVGFAHAYCSRSGSGYYARLKIPHNVSAVSSLCMVVRRDVFLGCGGFCEALSFGILNDADLGLRLARAGLRHVILPSTELTLGYSKGTVSIGAPHQNASISDDHRLFLQRWGPLRVDRFYSSNHQLGRTNSLLAF